MKFLELNIYKNIFGEKKRKFSKKRENFTKQKPCYNKKLKYTGYHFLKKKLIHVCRLPL